VRSEAATVPEPNAKRLLYIDNLRMVLITLVVAGHLAITYGGVGDWYYKETEKPGPVFLILLLPLGAILSASLMGLFAFIAGYFTPRPYDRKGPGLFLLDRLKRLVIPLVIFELAFNPLARYIRDIHLGRFRGTFWEFLRAYLSPLRSYADGPVWFLLMLLIFSLFYTGWRLSSRALHREPRPSLSGVPGNGSIALFALGMGLAMFVVRIGASVGNRFEPWHQELAHYPQYILMFAAGIRAYRRGWLDAFSEAQARLWRRLSPLIVVSLAGVLVAAGALRGAFDKRIDGGFNGISLAFSMWEGWTCVSVSILLLVWFRRRFDGAGRLSREMAAASFGVYVIHPAVIVPLAIALSGISMDLSLKYILVLPIALALCYLAAALLRRLPLLRGFF
jgi:glucans biosynthesis protein C